MRSRLLALVLLAVVLSGSGMAAADSFEPDAGTVRLGDDPGQRDSVTFYVPNDVENPEAFAKTAVRDADLPVREVRTDEEEATDAYTPIHVTTTVGERTGLLSRTVDSSTLSSLAVFEESTVVVDIMDVATVDGVDRRIEQDGSRTLYAVSGDRDISYKLPFLRLGLFPTIVVAMTILPFVGFRWYGQRVVNREAAVEEKTHRLRIATAVGTFPLMIVLVPVLFEARLIDTTLLVVSGLLPGFSGSEIGEMILIMGTIIVPLVLSLLSVVLAVFPYDKQLRDTTIDSRSTAKKFVAGIAIGLLPMLGWFLLITQLPPGVFDNEAISIALLAVFLGVVMAVQPYLIMLLQDTSELQGPLRERINEFCAERQRPPRNVYRIDGGGNKLANALVAGTIPGLNYVFLTDYLIEEFPEEEIEAIVAHELGHIAHRHLWYRGGLALAVFGAWMLGFDRIGLDALADQFGFYGFFLPFMGLMAVYLVGIRGWLAVRQEHEADSYAAAQTDTETTVSALRRLGDANHQRENTGRLYNLLTLHPSIADRVEKLRASESPVEQRSETTEAR